MDLKEMIREVVREELATMLPSPTDPPVASDHERAEAWLAGAEARLQNLVNSTESKVATQLAALRVLTPGGNE